MSRSWPYLSAVAVVGVLAGTAIGGRPVGRDEFVISPDQIPTTTVAAGDSATSIPIGSALPTPVTTTTITSTASSTTVASVVDSTTTSTRPGGTVGAPAGTDTTG